MKPKVIVRSDALPQHLQTELHAMQAALEQKYGPAAHMVGTMLENMANVCSMVRGEMPAEDRAKAYERSREVCAEILSLLAHLLRVEKPAALAVARAYREFGAHAEEELLGADAALSDTKGEALAAIAKAATIH